MQRPTLDIICVLMIIASSAHSQQSKTSLSISTGPTLVLGPESDSDTSPHGIT